MAVAFNGLATSARSQGRPDVSGAWARGAADLPVPPGSRVESAMGRGPLNCGNRTREVARVMGAVLGG